MKYYTKFVINIRNVREKLFLIILNQMNSKCLPVQMFNYFLNFTYPMVYEIFWQSKHMNTKVEVTTWLPYLSRQTIKRNNHKSDINNARWSVKFIFFCLKFFLRHFSATLSSRCDFSRLQPLQCSFTPQTEYISTGYNGMTNHLFLFSWQQDAEETQVQLNFIFCRMWFTVPLWLFSIVNWREFRTLLTT